MSTFAQQAALAQSQGFQARVQAAMVLSAASILAETPPTPPKPVTEQLRQQLASEVMASPSQFVTRFAWACAVGSPLQADISSVVLGIASTTTGPPAAITTATAHGLSTGAIVAISGAQDPNLAGTWPVTVTSTTAFTIPTVGSAPGTAGGTVTPQPPDSDIQSGVSANWNWIAGVMNNTV